MQFLGNGPYRVWKNRLAGGNFNVWDKIYNQSITGHSGFTYPEFKGYYSNLYWADILDDNNRGFRIFCRSEDIFLRLLTPGEPPEPRNTALNHPDGTISFMHGIPAIGTKFKEAELLGPQSRNYQYMSRRVKGGKLNMSLTFDFRQ